MVCWNSGVYSLRVDNTWICPANGDIGKDDDKMLTLHLKVDQSQVVACRRVEFRIREAETDNIREFERDGRTEGERNE